MCFEKQPESEHAVMHLDNALEKISNLIEDADMPSEFKSICINLTNTYRDLVMRSILPIIDNKMLDTPIYEHWSTILQVFIDYGLSSSELDSLKMRLSSTWLDHIFIGFKKKEKESIISRHLAK